MSRRRKSLPQRKHVTVREAAEYLDVAPKTIRKCIALGRLPAVRPGPRTIRIDVADLDRLAVPCGPAAGPDPVERIAKLVADSPLTDDQVDRLASLLRNGAG